MSPTLEQAAELRKLLRRVLELNHDCMPCAFKGATLEASMEYCKRRCHGEWFDGDEDGRVLWSQCLSFNLNLYLKAMKAILDKMEAS